ncbi:hypothetical protein [Umezawaea tangerina]|uniref:hypothetical protein n=1 Tax=Umezawaea tangerina TaxID=84725 RepID=UPI001B80702F|nr:hypothetical protein [Umezawaea tangerina]
MIEPTGPRPASVYWRRRAVALGVSILALLLAIWLIGSLIGRTDPQPQLQAVTSTPPSTPPSTAPASSSTSPPPPPPAPPAPPSPTAPPGPPAACEDAQVNVVAEVPKPSYEIGQQPEFKIHVSNVGQLPCTKDIGRAVRELVVTSADGATQLWSSNHCFATEGTEVRVMQPREVFTYGLSWAGSTSDEGCRTHTRVGPGDYLLIAKVAGKASNPVVFRLT